MKSFVFCLMSLALVSAASAQGVQRGGFLNRMRQQSGARPAPAAPQAAAASKTVAAESGGRSIEFNGTPVDLVFEVYGALVGRTVLKDPQVPSATITLQPRKGQELSDADKIEAVETVLEMNGIHMEPYGEKFVRALPRKSVRNEGIPLYLDLKALEAAVEAGLVTDGKVVSLMIRFKYLNDEDMQNVAQKVLESLKSPSGVTLVLSKSHQVLVTDTYQNIKRMLEIVPEIDVKQPEDPLPEIECIPIRNAKAANIVAVIKEIVADSMKEQELQQKKVGTQQPAQQAPARSILSRIRRPGEQAQPKEPESAPSLVINASAAAHGIIRGRVTVIAENDSNKIVLITSAENMRVFKGIIEALDVKNIDVDVKVYRLKYAEAEDVSDMINDLIGNTASSKDSKSGSSTKQQGTSANLTRNTQAPASRVTNQRQGGVSAGELNKDNTTVLADKRINGLVVMTQKELFPTIEQIIESMDIKLSQVLIETVIIEVGLGDDLSTGIDWVNNQWTGKDPSVIGGGGGGSNSGTLTSMKGTVKKYSEYLNDAKQILGNDSTTYGNVSYEEKQSAIEKLAKSLQDADLNDIGSVTPVGTGINYFMKSDKLNISAVINAAKTDSHSKYIASPIIMTLDNKEATIEATEMRYLFKGYQYSGSTYNGSAVPDYEQKELGITIKTTPKINPNGTVMLTIEEEYSQEGGGQAITAANGSDKISAATTITRKMSADALLENGQTVIFGGLTETVKSEKTGGIPILKDIPFVGKWLFGYVEESEGRKELLVFMTPYVLDDAQAAQAEALRRKRAISDTSAWDDHGWSASKLADPVSKQEQLRRIKEEWRKQDADRRAKVALEREKVMRAKELQAMSAEEREMWLKMHKEELEEEKREELERKMLDPDSQEDLKKFVDQIRQNRLEAAEKEIKASDDEYKADNERSKIDSAAEAKRLSARINEAIDRHLGGRPSVRDDFRARANRLSGDYEAGTLGFDAFRGRAAALVREIKAQVAEPAETQQGAADRAGTLQLIDALAEETEK